MTAAPRGGNLGPLMTTVARTRTVSLSRRQFLWRCGVLGATVAVARLPAPPAARAAIDPDRAAEALRLLALDTITGLVAFVVPGPDAYSRAQGLTHPQPGAVDARAADGMIELLDAFVPMPDSFVQALAAAAAGGMSEVPVPALDPLLRAAEGAAATLDRALQAAVANDGTVPLSLLVALLLNFSASSVNPAAVSGPFPGAPFANLGYGEKAEVFRRMEEGDAELVALLDANAPEPMRASLSGQVRFMAGALLEGPALFTYSEYAAFDRERGIATSRPIGWEMSRYMPGRTSPSDGWDEFKGYYEGRRRAARRRRARRRRGRGHA